MARRVIDWPEAAARLAAAVPRERLHPRVVAWAEREENRARPWAVAFSGGADSLSVLLLVWMHWPEQRRRLRGLHFDHRLRGRASAGDARFCAEVCAGLRVQLHGGVWDERPRRVSEAAARAARMGFFSAALGKRERAAIWFGHQQDDVAETLLMRLARGSGTTGLAAPRPVQVVAGGRVHLRPLLSLAKDEVRAALAHEEIPWREDASNAAGDFFRNRVRLHVVPAWREAARGRDVVAGAARARELIEEDDEAMEAWVNQLRLFTPAGSLRLAVLAGLPRAVVRRAVARWLARHQLSETLSRQAAETLLANVERARPMRQSAGRDAFAVIRNDLLRMERKPAVTSAKPGGVL